MKHNVMSLNMKPITFYARNQVSEAKAHCGELGVEMRSASGNAFWKKPASNHLQRSNPVLLQVSCNS